MSYTYVEYRKYALTDDGQIKTLALLRFANRALEMAGAVRADKLMAAAGSGTSWDLMACVDRLVELDELREVVSAGTTAWQYRVFVSGRHD